MWFLYLLSGLGLISVSLTTMCVIFDFIYCKRRNLRFLQYMADTLKKIDEEEMEMERERLESKIPKLQEKLEQIISYEKRLEEMK